MPHYRASHVASAGRCGGVVNHYAFPGVSGEPSLSGRRRPWIIVVHGRIGTSSSTPPERMPADDRREASAVDGLGRVTADSASRAAYPPAGRLLFPGPGRSCIVAWRDVEQMLRGRLAHPEHLHDDCQLSCQVQVYEALRPQRIEDIAARFLGDPALIGNLHPLTGALIRRLALQDALPPGPPSPPQRRAPGAVLAGDRIAWLHVADDPTASPPALMSPPVASMTHAGPAHRRTAVPERYLTPWELHRSREEAIFDMQLSASGGFLRRLLRRVCAPRVSRAEMLRWQVMLSGKSLDDQLWAVRPPTHGLTHATVRSWVEGALAHGGYDVGVMLAEWEIYWRRKA